MDRQEALALLTSPSAHARGQAARALGDEGTPTDLQAIRNAQRRETVSYVQYAMQEAVSRLTNRIQATNETEDDGAEVPAEVRQQIYGRAVEWVTGFLLHEIASPVGLATRSAKREIGDQWEMSATRRHLDTIHRVFGAIEMLKNAAGVPRPQEFDLAALLQEFIDTELTEADGWISPIGPKPFLLNGDPALIRMAVSNGLRNAVESVTSAGAAPGEHAVIINWGVTDLDYWVSVLDRGPGIAGSSEAAFDIGRTTKQKHSGFGLAIARQAIETLAGTVTLEPARGGGALYTARWHR